MTDKLEEVSDYIRTIDDPATLYALLADVTSRINGLRPTDIRHDGQGLDVQVQILSSTDDNNPLQRQGEVSLRIAQSHLSQAVQEMSHLLYAR